MTAKDLKPYTFWLVCGVILLAEVVAMVVITPQHEDFGEMTPAEAKQVADGQYSREIANGLLKKANETLRTKGPPGPIDRRDQAAVKRVLNDYIITDDWKGNLQTAVNEHTKMTSDMKTELVRRSRILTRPIHESSDLNIWYDAYAKASAALLRQLIDAQVVVPAQTTGAVGAKIEETDLLRNARFRDPIGLVTTDAYPSAEQHPLMTRRFRIIEAVAKALMASPGTTRPNPLIPEKWRLGAPSTRLVQLLDLRWDEQQRNPVSPRHGQENRFTLRLTGPLASLQAALAAIDGISEPVLVRLGGEWTRGRTSQPAVAGGDLVDEPIEVTCTVVVLDFLTTLKDDKDVRPEVLAEATP